jgi:Zn-dependent peptidase ImmA (M78 family)/DNA-binding XRE family transcriptional regulator
MEKSPSIDRLSLGENLRRLRQSRGITQSSLAQQASISLPTLRNVESGKVMPKVDTLQLIAHALETSILELLKPARALRHVRFRAKRKLRTRNEILVDVARWLENLRELEQLVGYQAQASHFEEIQAELDRRANSKNRAEFAAEILRDKWGLGPHEPVRNICGLFVKHGLRIFSLPKESREFFGLSVGPGDGGPAVIVNTWERISVERWIFSAAHELGHLILHQDAFDAEKTEEVSQQEAEANIFAAHFLMPDDAFDNELKSLRGLHWVDIILVLKRIFKVSWKTVVIRLQQKELLDESAWRRFHTQFKLRYGYSLEGFKEPYPLSIIDYVDNWREPETLRYADFPANQLLIRARLREALELGKITLSRAAKILGCGNEEMRELAKEWKIRAYA